MRGLHTGCQSLRLHGQDQLTAAAPFGTVVRNKGVRVDPAGQHSFDRIQREVCLAPFARCPVAEGIHAAAVKRQPLYVYFGYKQRTSGRERCALSQNTAVFGDQGMPGEDRVGGRFTVPAVGVQVGGNQSAGLPGDKTPSVFRLAYRFVGGGQIADDGRPGRCRRRGGRNRCPQILADFHGKAEVGHISADEQLPGSEGDVLPVQFIGQVAVRRGGKLPCLVEFGIVRQMRLGYQSQYLPAPADGGAVIQFSCVRDRKPDDSYHIVSGCRGGKLPQSL